MVGKSLPRVDEVGSTSTSRMGDAGAAAMTSVGARGARSAVKSNHADRQDREPLVVLGDWMSPAKTWLSVGLAMPVRSGVPVEVRRRSLGQGKS